MTDPTGTTFRTTLELGGKTATGLEVPPHVVATLGSSKRPAVRVTINGYTYRSTVASMGGRFLLPVSAEVRSAAGVHAGDEVEVRVELDTAPREVDVPPELAAALERAPEVKTAFDSLSYTKRKEMARSVADAKTPQTRDRRIAKAIEDVQAGLT